MDDMLAGASAATTRCSSSEDPSLSDEDEVGTGRLNQPSVSDNSQPCCDVSAERLVAAVRDQFGSPAKHSSTTEHPLTSSEFPVDEERRSVDIL